MALAVPLLGLGAFAVMSLLSGPAQATPTNVCTWNGRASTDMTNNTNWTANSGGTCGSGSGAGTARLSGAQLVFPATIPSTGSTLDLNASLSPDDIVFKGSYTLTGTTYTLTLSGANNLVSNWPVAIDATSGTSTIGSAVAFSNGVDLEASSGAGVIVTGTVSGSGGGVIVNSNGGSGTIALSGDDSTSLSVAIFVDNGTLEVENDTALGSTSGVSVAPGAELDLEGGLSIPSSIDVTSLSGTLGEFGTGSVTWAGTIHLTGSSGTVSANSGYTLDVTGAISGAALTTSGGGTVKLSGTNTNTYTGGTTVADFGTLVAAGSGDALGTGAVAVVGTSTLVLDPSSAQAYGNTLVLGSGEGGFDVLQDGSSTNADSWTGGVTLTTNSSGVIESASPSDGSYASGSFVVSGVIGNSGSGSLYTAGNVTLSGTNTYTGGTGGTTVYSGTLDVTGSIANSNVTVDPVTTLEGTGLTGPVSCDGTLLPGAPGAPGALSVAGAAFGPQPDPPTLAVDITGKTPGSGHSQLDSAGSVLLSSTTVLQVTDSYAAPYGTVFDIVTSDGITGAFANASNGATITSTGGRLLRVGYTSTEVTLTDVTNPPPPPPPPAPSVTSISPTSGSTSGDTSVTITGADLSGAAYVFFGSTAATSYTVNSSTSITAVSPAGSAGTVNITVTTPGGTSATNSADQFTYLAPSSPPSAPSVTSISPTSGSTSGGTTVTITGTNFASGATVMFGGTAATAVTVSSSTSIVAISPAESAGTVNVTVTTPGGASATSSADQFTFVTPITGDAYTPVNPMRLADTRCSASPAPDFCAGENLPSANATLGDLAGGKTENVSVTGVDGIPLTATAVVINVTAVDMTAGGYLSIYPEDSTPAVVSSLNWTPSSGVVTNLVTVPVNTTNGEITVENGGLSGTVNFIVDIEGYYAPPGGTSAGLYNAVTPTRLADTRCSESSPSPGVTSSYCSAVPSANSNLATLGAGMTENVTVTGVGNVPSGGVSAVVLNLTAVNTSSNGYFTAYPAGATRAMVSTVNWVAGQTVSNRVIVKVGANGEITLYNNSGTANFIVDVSGYYTDGSSTSETGSLFNPVTPARIVDTRCAVSSPPSNCSSENLPSANATLGAVSAGKSIAAQVAGIDNIPSSATAFVGNVTATGGTGGGYLTVYSNSTAPTTSDVNFGVGTTDANMVIGGLTSSGTVNIANGGGSGNINVLVDVSGWFTKATS